MANSGQLARLRSERKKWNRWREEHIKDSIDLSESDLSNLDLTGTNLMCADLHEADLSGTSISEANLVRAVLRDADLTGADLTGADLTGADLSRTYLNRAILDKANLSGTYLSETNLNGTTFIYSNLSEANLSRNDFTRANLSGANLSGANLSGANLSGVNLSGVNLTRANLSGANLSGANLDNTNLIEANFSNANLINQNLSNTNLNGANLIGANLTGANLIGANLTGAQLTGQDLSNKNLSRANLTRANLTRTLLVGTDFKEAILTDCIIYGIAAWNVQLENATQKNLIITNEHEAIITVDNLKVAQFIYLMLNNKEIRDVINTLTTKSVLILGRFTNKRKAVLEALRETLRKNNYLPILFDFEKPSHLDFTETVITLAHLSRFVIIDLTDPNSSPHEAAMVIPQCHIPFLPILEEPGKEYPMFEDLRRRYPWVLETYHYQNKDTLIASLEEHIIRPAEHKAEELEKLKNTK